MGEFNHDAKTASEACGLKENEFFEISTSLKEELKNKNDASNSSNGLKKSEMVEIIFNKAKESDATIKLLALDFVIDSCTLGPTPPPGFSDFLKTLSLSEDKPSE